ncbi:hypothetical protein ACIGCZ_36285 [Streptomyces nigra]|uniref:hypothetical protein n=1 Tax=Streptomyces nigra TaxID=1827580 RepID=UPI0037CE1CA8
MPTYSSPLWQNSSLVWQKAHVQASSSGGGGFNSTFTWAALLAIVALVLTYLYRRFDQTAKQLEQESVVLGKMLTELDNLADTVVTEADLKELKTLLSLVKQGEERFPKMGFGTIVATVEAYEKTAISEECAKKINKILLDKKSRDEALRLSREQGLWLDRSRSAIKAVRSVIDRRLRR